MHEKSRDIGWPIEGYDRNGRRIERCGWTIPGWAFALLAGLGLGFTVALEVMQ